MILLRSMTGFGQYYLGKLKQVTIEIRAINPFWRSTGEVAPPVPLEEESNVPCSKKCQGAL